MIACGARSETDSLAGMRLIAARFGRRGVVPYGNTHRNSKGACHSQKPRSNRDGQARLEVADMNAPIVMWEARTHVSGAIATPFLATSNASRPETQTVRGHMCLA
jgi:hypothetical protein